MQPRQGERESDLNVDEATREETEGRNGHSEEDVVRLYFSSKLAQVGV